MDTESTSLKAYGHHHFCESKNHSTTEKKEASEHYRVSKNPKKDQLPNPKNKIKSNTEMRQNFGQTMQFASHGINILKRKED